MSMISTRPLLGMLLGGALLALPLFPAHGVVVDFGATVEDDFDPTETYTEDGFIFTVVSGDEWAIGNGFGNPAESLIAGDLGAVGVGSLITVMRVGGGLFTFDAVDFGSDSDRQTDAVDLIGLVDASETESVLNLHSLTTGFTAGFDPGFGAAIDKLHIVGGAGGEDSLYLDNFVFTLVVTPPPTGMPEPGTLALFGLAGLGLVGRRLLR